MTTTLTAAQLIELARPFLDTCGDRARVHLRPGELAATDGRVLLHVFRPDIAPDSPAEEDSILDYRPIGQETVVARRDFLATLAGFVLPVRRRAHEELLRRQREFDADPFAELRDEVFCCPCCGTQLVYDSGDALEAAEYIERYRPDVRDEKGVAMIHGAVRTVAVGLRYLAVVLEAAGALGAAETLSFVGSAPTLVFRGDGWFAALMPLRIDLDDDGGEFDVDIDLPEGGE